jgi:hypothetical protein
VGVTRITGSSWVSSGEIVFPTETSALGYVTDNRAVGVKSSTTCGMMPCFLKLLVDTGELAN